MIGKGNKKAAKVSRTHSDTDKTSFTVCSNFGTKEPWEVTLVVLNKPEGNLFFDKHVLRLNEDSEEVLLLRQGPNAQGDYANTPVELIGKALENYGVIKGNKINIKQAPASTMIVLQKIDSKLVWYTIADAFLDAMLEDKFGDYKKEATSGNCNLTITFPSECVETRERGGSEPTIGKTMIIGGKRISPINGDPIKVTFDINHSDGAGPSSEDE